MTTTRTLPILAIAAALSLTACAGSTEASPEPAVTTTVTATASPEPAVTETETTTKTATVTESPEPAATSEEEVVGDSDLAAAALDLTWDGMTDSEQDDLCFGWNLVPTESLDVFMENSEGFISREQAKTFFDTKCEDF